MTTTTLLSQRAESSPSWLRVLPKRGIGRGITSIFRVLCDKAKRGCASHVPLSPGAPARRTTGVLVEGATPPFLDAGASSASVNRRTQWRTINTRLGGVAPSTVIPAGRPSSRPRSRQRKSSRPQTAHRPRGARLGDAHNRIAAIRNAGSLPLHLTVPDSVLILG